MCDPFTIMAAVGAVGGAASSLFGAKQSAPNVPKAVVPAVAADAAKASTPEVKVGAEDHTKDPNNPDGQAPKLVQERKQATTIGGLGRGGLII